MELGYAVQSGRECKVIRGPPEESLLLKMLAQGKNDKVIRS
jgi:hypothetical protein